MDCLVVEDQVARSKRRAKVKSGESGRPKESRRLNPFLLSTSAKGEMKASERRLGAVYEAGTDAACYSVAVSPSPAADAGSALHLRPAVSDVDEMDNFHVVDDVHLSTLFPLFCVWFGAA